MLQFKIQNASTNRGHVKKDKLSHATESVISGGSITICTRHCIYQLYKTKVALKSRQPWLLSIKCQHMVVLYGHLMRDDAHYFEVSFSIMQSESYLNWKNIRKFPSSSGSMHAFRHTSTQWKEMSASANMTNAGNPVTCRQASALIHN